MVSRTSRCNLWLSLICIWCHTTPSLSATTTTTTPSTELNDAPDGSRPNHTHCNVSIEVNIILNDDELTAASNETQLQAMVLDWIHLHLFNLISSSFVYHLDMPHDVLWDAYDVRSIQTHDNDTLAMINNTHTLQLQLAVAICSSSHDLEEIIHFEFLKNSDEMSAFVAYQLRQHLNTSTPLTVDIALVTPSPLSSTDTVLTAVLQTTSTSTSSSTATATSSIFASVFEADEETDVNGNFAFEMLWRAPMLYMLVIGVCVVVIIALLCVVVCAICIKRKSDQKLKTALNEIRQHRSQVSQQHIQQHIHSMSKKAPAAAAVHARANKRHSRRNLGLHYSEREREQEPENGVDFDDTHSVFSIEPVAMASRAISPPQMSPQHLLTIDHGLQHDDDDTASVRVQRNALMAVNMQQKLNGHNLPSSSSSSSSANSSSNSLSSQSSLSWTFHAHRHPQQNVFQAPPISAADLDELRMSSARNAKQSFSQQSNSVFIERERERHVLSAPNSQLSQRNNLANLAYHQIPLKNAASDPSFHNKSSAEEDAYVDEHGSSDDSIAKLSSIRGRRKTQIRKYRQAQCHSQSVQISRARGRGRGRGRRMALAQPKAKAKKAADLRHNASQPNLLHRSGKRKFNMASASLSLQYASGRPLPPIRPIIGDIRVPIPVASCQPPAPHPLTFELADVPEVSLDPRIANPQPLPSLNRSWRSHSESSLSSQPMQSETATTTTNHGEGRRVVDSGSGGLSHSLHSDANSNLVMAQSRQISISTMKTVDEHLQSHPRYPRMMDIPPPPPLPAPQKKQSDGADDEEEDEEDANTVVIVADNDNVLDAEYECSSKFDDASSTFANYEVASVRSNLINL